MKDKELEEILAKAVVGEDYISVNENGQKKIDLATKRLNLLFQKYGVVAQNYQELEEAMKLNGINIEDMEIALKSIANIFPNAIVKLDVTENTPNMPEIFLLVIDPTRKLNDLQRKFYLLLNRFIIPANLPLGLNFGYSKEWI